MLHHLVDLNQVCTNIAIGTNNQPTAGVTYAYIKSTFSEYGHVVAYQIKWNEAYNNMIANVLPLHTPLTPQVGQKVIFSLLKVDMLHVKLMAMKQCKQIFCPFIYPQPPDGVKRSKQFIF